MPFVAGGRHGYRKRIFLIVLAKNQNPANIHLTTAAKKLQTVGSERAFFDTPPEVTDLHCIEGDAVSFCKSRLTLRCHRPDIPAQPSEIPLR